MRQLLLLPTFLVLSLTAWGDKSCSELYGKICTGDEVVVDFQGESYLRGIVKEVGPITHDPLFHGQRIQTQRFRVVSPNGSRERTYKIVKWDTGLLDRRVGHAIYTINDEQLLIPAAMGETEVQMSLNDFIKDKVSLTINGAGSYQMSLKATKKIRVDSIFPGLVSRQDFKSQVETRLEEACHKLFYHSEVLDFKAKLKSSRPEKLRDGGCDGDLSYYECHAPEYDVQVEAEAQANCSRIK